MKVSLSRLLLNHSGLFQQIIQDNSTHWICLVIKLNVHELAESTGVVVSVSFGVSESF